MRDGVVGDAYCMLTTPFVILRLVKDRMVQQMVHMREIEGFSRRVARDFKPQRIILFGSYAWGKPTEDSDVDLLVILQLENGAIEKSVEILMKEDPKFPLDLLVRSPEKISERVEMGDTFMANILNNGRVLYEADDEGMGRES